MRLAILLVVAVAAGYAAAPAAGDGFGFELIGHDPLLGRGMNSAPAIFGDFVYIGSRTDSSGGRPHPGVLILEVADPTAPRLVGEIGGRDQGNPGETSRELRVWPHARLLIVVNFPCTRALHRCGPQAPPATIRFYDLADPSSPELVSTYLPSNTPHEVFLWVDPARPERALLFIATNTSGRQPNLIVTDIGRARESVFEEVMLWAGGAAVPGAGSARLHSVSVSSDGTRAYLAYGSAGVLTAELEGAGGGAMSLRPLSRFRWERADAHSAVAVAGTGLVLVTEERYRPCPWAWGRLIDIGGDPPRVTSELKVPENEPAACGRSEGVYSSHNPTVVPGLAFVSWHAAGLRAFSIEDPSRPVETGAFLPEPLPSVATEDPVLTRDGPRVAVWSYPVIKDGLIYVVDVRNGLYVLEYTGAGADRMGGIAFAEGNSNLGTSTREPPDASPAPSEGRMVEMPPSGASSSPPGQGAPVAWLAAPISALAGLLLALLARARRRAREKRTAPDSMEAGSMEDLG